MRMVLPTTIMKLRLTLSLEYKTKRMEIEIGLSTVLETYPDQNYVRKIHSALVLVLFSRIFQHRCWQNSREIISNLKCVYSGLFEC